MRTVITLVIGFWLGRQFYINYEAAQKPTTQPETPPQPPHE